MNFWKLIGIFAVILLWKISYFQILGIIRIIEKFWNCDINSSMLMCEFLKICWYIFGNFNMKILFYWVIENVGIIGIVEIIEQFWSLWHSLASWLYEKKNLWKVYEMEKKNSDEKRKPCEAN